MTAAIPKPRHDARERRGGRFAPSQACDACGKPCGTEYGTDDEVCAGGDGPGFYLCSRLRCARRRGGTVEERRAHYAAQRERNREAGR